MRQVNVGATRAAIRIVAHVRDVCGSHLADQVDWVEVRAATLAAWNAGYQQAKDDAASETMRADQKAFRDTITALARRNAEPLPEVDKS